MDSGESSSGGGGRGGGGAGGGGKIRTRRYHLAAASQKPYPKNKQGIINIVKESVKNIVPTWLQRYFRQSEEASPGEQRQLEENINYHPAFEDDTADNSIEIDGRITPEPTRVTLEEPSTSRSGLNFTDILTRPSLHRGHLNCSILDSPPPFCQPSTSSAFPISNTGLSLGKEIKDSTSQHDDDNISTTSGFSSRASDKDIQVSKNASAPPLWSTETERPVTISQHSSSSSKKPGFNLSAFGALSPSLGNASVLKISQLGNSPFYPGKTTYGGAAAAARQSRLAVTPYQTPIRRQMKAKQVNTQSYGVTSSTARRILQSLEKMSSPLADAKRIPPSISSSLSPPVERSMLNIMDFHSPSKRAKSHYPPVQKLVTPKNVSLSVNRSQYFKPSLTSADSGRIRQRIEMDHKGMHEKNVTVEQQSKPRESSETSLKFSTSASNGLPPAAGTGGGKMRRERGVHYVSKPTQDEVMEVPPLPEISLPISTSSLPNFSFGPLTSTTVKSSPVSAAQSIVNKVQPAGNTGSPVFRFSSPIVKSTEAEVLPPVSVGGFKFSVPVAKSSDHSEPMETPGLPLTNATVNSISKKREMECDGPLKPAKVLKEGSVLDILKSPGFSSPTTSSTYSAAATPPVGTSTVVYTRPAINSFSGVSVSGLGDLSKKQASSSWQCDACLIQNKQADNKCIACQAAKVPASDNTKEAGTLTQNITVKSAVSTTGTQSFAEKFKAAAGTWDCDTCLVQNKRESTKCVACETPKPGTGVKQALVLPFVTDSATPVSSSSSFSDGSATLGFGDKFKKPKDAWECSVCLVSNKAEDSKCVACQSDKAGGSVPVVSSSASSLPALSGGFLGLDKFKKPEGSWDCETCLVQNKADATKCIACESPKPGSKPEPKGFSTATTSAPSFSASSTPSFKFGIQSSSSETTQTLGSTGKNFKFGEQGGFKFGITSELGSSASTVTGGFKFSKTEGSKPGSFPSESKSEDSKGGKNSSTFSFGLPSGTSSASTASFQFGIANPGQQEKKEGLNQPAVGGFTFGSGSSASAAVAEKKTEISGFKFGNAEEKEASVTAFLLKKPEEKKDEIPLIKGGFTFGNVESATPPTVVLGRTDEKQESVSNPLVFGKKAENDSSKAQSIFSFGKAEQTKEEGPLKPAFSFSLAKPVEKEMEPAKPAFTFGAKGSTADAGSAKSTFSFLSSTTSNAVIPSVSLGGSGGSSTGGSSSSNCIFSNTTSSLNPPPLFLFGQASNTVSSSAFGNPSESSTSQPFGFSQDTKPPTTTTSTGTPVQFLFGTVATTNTTANTGFSFAAPATTAPPTGSSSSSFVFGSGFSAPAAGPAFGASQTPTFGQTQGSSQPPAPSFGSLSTASLFPVGSQPAPPAFGSVSSSTQPPVFGQQAAQQPGFGSGTSSNTGPVFGSSTANFNFTGNSPGIFTFGATPSASAAQPAGSSGFPFTQPSPSFTLGSNGKNIFSASGSSVSGRKIKTAVRRRK